jgi:hypothetical protein
MEDNFYHIRVLFERIENGRDHLMHVDVFQKISSSFFSVADAHLAAKTRRQTKLAIAMLRWATSMPLLPPSYIGVSMITEYPGYLNISLSDMSLSHTLFRRSLYP